MQATHVYFSLLPLLFIVVSDLHCCHYYPLLCLIVIVVQAVRGEAVRAVSGRHLGK